MSKIPWQAVAKIASYSMHVLYHKKTMTHSVLVNIGTYIYWIMYMYSKKQIPKRQDILRIQSMIQNMTQLGWDCKYSTLFQSHLQIEEEDEDDFERRRRRWRWLWNKVENLQSQPASCFESYIVFSRCVVFSEFVFYFTFLNCRLVMGFLLLFFYVHVFPMHFPNSVIKKTILYMPCWFLFIQLFFVITRWPVSVRANGHILLNSEKVWYSNNMPCNACTCTSRISDWQWKYYLSTIDYIVALISSYSFVCTQANSGSVLLYTVVI